MAQTLRALAALSEFHSQNPLLPGPAAPVALMPSDLRGVCVYTFHLAPGPSVSPESSAMREMEQNLPVFLLLLLLNFGTGPQVSGSTRRQG